MRSATATKQGRIGRYAPDTLAPPPHWGADAQCRRSETPDIWFAEDDDPGAKEERLLAKAICGQCACRPSCLTAALERGERAGVWGGLDTEERNQLIVHPAVRKEAPVEESSGGPPAEHAATA
ncbi:WhiB family transcriptional regulator [Streptomyces sp. AMCC400023]|uniref:WhiB family transcriptional regulator n=1 Tax=Streptomyces sp. AMCC400023 TaxID=2056258 RepID=UPI001F174490|nr:WhiB family transcriptional regulator [Streptomyces sp. AMCC400023]UJV42918.1 WhiB family transcriptional regulator [Streptomyces sp. AMCC400023]